MGETTPEWSLRAKDNTEAFNAVLQAAILATSENLTGAEAQELADHRHAEYAPGLTAAELLILLGVTRRKTAQFQNRPVPERPAAARSSRRQLRGWRHSHTALLHEALRRNMKVPARLA